MRRHLPIGCLDRRKWQPRVCSGTPVGCVRRCVHSRCGTASHRLFVYTLLHHYTIHVCSTTAVKRVAGWLALWSDARCCTALHWKCNNMLRLAGVR